MLIMRDLVARVTAEQATPVWWMWLDADEFPHGPGGRTVANYLATLDRRFRIVGARYLNHYPMALPHYERGCHPLDYQPMAEPYDHAFCPQLHRKHILQLQIPGRPPIECGAGFHLALSPERPLLEPTGGIVLHHFPFRTEAAARQRLAALCEPTAEGMQRACADDIATPHMLARARALDAVYAQRWHDVETMATRDGGVIQGVTLAPWTELVPPQDRKVARSVTDPARVWSCALAVLITGLLPTTHRCHRTAGESLGTTVLPIFPRQPSAIARQFQRRCVSARWGAKGRFAMGFSTPRGARRAPQQPSGPLHVGFLSNFEGCSSAATHMHRDGPAGPRWRHCAGRISSRSDRSRISKPARRKRKP